MSVSNFLNGLDAAVTYHFRLAASNSVGIALGGELPVGALAVLVDLAGVADRAVDAAIAARVLVDRATQVAKSRSVR